MDTNSQALRGIVANAAELIELKAFAGDFLSGKARPRSRNLAGAHASRSRGRGMSFAEVRHYQAGDDVRNIDWRVTARTQRTHTKLFEEEKERPVFVLVDQRQSMFFGSREQFKSVFAAKLACLAAWASQNKHDRIGALLFNDHQQIDLRPRQGKNACLHLINKLVQLNQHLFEQKDQVRSDAGLSLQTMLEEVLRISRPGSLIYVISDFNDFNRECERALALLSRHNELRFLHVSDQLERELPKSNSAALISDGLQRLRLDCSSKRLRSSYRQSWLTQLKELENTCMQYRIDLRLFSSDQRLQAQLSPAPGHTGIKLSGLAHGNNSTNKVTAGTL
ncbi:DUF58 domain-containing protein [Agaribacterium haliotis]|uniref:DUF58 domain-containing protein n=1 Tax=Agaribacterium haliotis TaxID=2013869 RepID=UPI000BB5583E|nr:DUF58 domain-containing protein [Agaribacterium haliotis]